MNLFGKWCYGIRRIVQKFLVSLFTTDVKPNAVRKLAFVRLRREGGRPKVNLKRRFAAFLKAPVHAAKPGGGYRQKRDFANESSFAESRPVRGPTFSLTGARKSGLKPFRLRYRGGSAKGSNKSEQGFIPATLKADFVVLFGVGYVRLWQYPTPRSLLTFFCLDTKESNKEKIKNLSLASNSSF